MACSVVVSSIYGNMSYNKKIMSPASGLGHKQAGGFAIVHTRKVMYKLILLFVSLPLSFVANAALSEGELEQLATKFVEAKNARQQPDTTIQDIDAFINLIADEFVDEHVKFKVTITEKSALREGLIAKMSDKIYYSSIVINEIMTGGNVAIIKMTESGKVRPNHLDKDITYSSVNIVTLEFNDAKLITHIRRHHG